MRWSIFLPLLLTACDLAPKAEIPTERVPQTWRNAPMETGQTSSIHWENLGSKELDSLITAALAHNTDIAVALANVAQARAATDIAGGPLTPQLDANGSASRSRTEAGDFTTNAHSSSAGLSVAYELDLWRKNLGALNSAQLQLTASEYDKDATALLVTSEVARLYTLVLGNDARIAVAAQNLENAQKVLSITDARHTAGATSGLELAQQKTAVANQRAALAQLKNGRESAFNQLAFLTGNPPAGLVLDSGNRLESLTVPEIPVSNPWELLARRPDIASAEATLRAANIDIGTARANALPSLQLGLEGILTGSPSGSVLSAAASFFAPIFHGGALQGEIERSKAVKDARMAAYDGVLLTAFKEVENALSTLESTSAREAALAESQEQAERAYTIARTQFDSGSIDFTTLLTTQDALLQSEDAHVQATQDRLAAAIDLMRALGGGWQKTEMKQ